MLKRSESHRLNCRFVNMTVDIDVTFDLCGDTACNTLHLCAFTRTDTELLVCYNHCVWLTGHGQVFIFLWWKSQSVALPGWNVDSTQKKMNRWTTEKRFAISLLHNVAKSTWTNLFSRFSPFCMWGNLNVTAYNYILGNSVRILHH